MSKQVIKSSKYLTKHPHYGSKKVFNSHKELVDFTLKIAESRAERISAEIKNMLIESMADEMLESVDEF